jgi:hypothetical protein
VSSTPELRALICSLAASLASRSRSPDADTRRPTSAGSGPSSPDAFAYFDRERSSWRTCQASLLADSETCSPTWPKRFTTRSSFAYALPTSARPTGASACSWLLPTPSAAESDPTEPLLEEIRAHLDPADPHHRLWLPGREWMSQRTLKRTAAALLPTPVAWLGRRPENAMADPERAASQGQRSIELPDALALLPTPTANEENPGAGGELRAALAHGPERRNLTGVDSWGRPNQGRPSQLLPTPTFQQGRNSTSARPDDSQHHAGTTLQDLAFSGAFTGLPSSPGSDCSDAPLPGQLTIEGA